MPWLPGLDGIEQRCWQQFLDCSLNLMAALNVRLMGEHDLTLRDVLLLDLLSRADRRVRRVCEIAAALGVAPSRLGIRLRRLEAHGLVTRSPNRRDPRGMLPRITGEGHMRLHAVLETYAEGVRAHYLDQIPREQMLTLVESCQRINEPLKPRTSDSGSPPGGSAIMGGPAVVYRGGGSLFWTG